MSARVPPHERKYKPEFGMLRWEEARLPRVIPCCPRTPLCTLPFALCWWWLPCLCNPQVARVYCCDLVKYWARPRLGRIFCGSFPFLALPLVFLLVAIFVEYPRALSNYGPVGGAGRACHIRVHRGENTTQTFTACDSKEACKANPLTRVNKTHGNGNALCELACPPWDQEASKLYGSWQKCWGNCVENGFKGAFTKAMKNGDVPILEQITVEYLPYTVTFSVPTLAEANTAGFGALAKMRPGLAGLHINITGTFARLLDQHDKTFVRFEKASGGGTYRSGVDGTKCYTPNYWWVHSSFDLEWEEFGMYLGEPEYTSSYCNPGNEIPGWAPSFGADPVIDNIVSYGTLSDPFTRSQKPPPADPASSLVDTTCRISLAPLPDPNTGKMPASIQYPAPLHPTVYVVTRQFGGWFISATQPEWPFRPYGTLVGLFWAGFTLFWLWTFFMNYACWITLLLPVLSYSTCCGPRQCWRVVQRTLMQPIRELIDCWLCVETPGLGDDGGITVSQRLPCYGECCCFCCICSDFNPNHKPCCGKIGLCAKFCSEDGHGTPGTFYVDKIGPTSNARLDYGHDYFRNRAADTFTNVPLPACFGGTSFDFPNANIRAVLLVGPQLIGKRTILKFAQARGFETCDLGAEAAPTPQVRWKNALAKFKALREDPARKSAAPVIFGAGGTAWEQHAMPAAEVVRLAQVEGVEVVFLLWEADAGEKTLASQSRTRRDSAQHLWTSDTTLAQGPGAGGAGVALVKTSEPLSIHYQKNCRAPAALTMCRWLQRVDQKNCNRDKLCAIKDRWVSASPKSSMSAEDANPWKRVFGRRIMVDMDPEEALVRILMPYRGRRTGPSILWGGCTKGAPSLSGDPVDIREFPKAQGDPFASESTHPVELSSRMVKLSHVAKSVKRNRRPSF